MSRCLINNFSSAALSVKRFRVFKDGQPKIQNCMVFNCGKVYSGGGISANVQAFNLNNSSESKVHNCTVYNIFDSSFNVVWGAFYGEYINTIIVNAGTCFRSVSGASNSNNISSDTTAPGTNSIINQTAGSLFISTTQGLEDLHLKGLAPALRRGLDLGILYDIQYDIDGYDRDSSVSAWDIGADQCDACKTSSIKANGRLSLGFSANQAVSSFNLSDF